MSTENKKTIDLGKIVIKSMVVLNVIAIIAALIQCIGAKKVGNKIYEVNKTSYYLGAAVYLISLVISCAVIIKKAYNHFVDEAVAAFGFAFWGAAVRFFDMNIFSIFLEVRPTGARSFTLFVWPIFTFILFYLCIMGIYNIALKHKELGSDSFRDELNDGLGIKRSVKTLYDKEMGEDK